MIVLCLLFECSQLSRFVLEEKAQNGNALAYGPYEITEAYTITRSHELSFLLSCCSIQSMTLHLQYKSHLLKWTALPIGVQSNLLQSTS